MAALPILIAPHPVLKQRAAAVERVDADTLRLLEDMLETMYEAAGIGLAAPQIGVSRRLVVVDVGSADSIPAPLRMIDPEIVSTSEGTNVYQEGCLSFPGYFADVERPEQITVRYRDATAQQRLLHAEGLLATCIQHEIDHLNGVVFVDHLSALKREMILSRLRRRQRDEKVAAA